MPAPKAAANQLCTFDDLPDLLTFARQQTPAAGDVYKLQNMLRDEYRRQGLPFKWTMPLRHLYQCDACHHTAPEILYALENPMPRDPRYPMRILKILESEIHQIREHGLLLKDEYRSFLNNVVLPAPNPLECEA
jgi:hypothetical protein